MRAVLRMHAVLIVAIAAAFALILSTAAHAATITVTTTSDVSSTDECTLRDAMNAANSQMMVNGCAAGTGDDTIVFASRVSGTITLDNELPGVFSGETLTIEGSAARGITIDGQSQYQLMEVGGTLNLQALTLANGNAETGGGIYNIGTLTVTNSTFSGNRGGDNGGGGIFNNGGTLTVTNSTFSGNSTYNGGPGGGIFNNGGTLTVTNSTFSGNSANDGGPGGGILNNGGTLTVINSTFSGNSANGGGFGGGISGGGTVTVHGTLLADETGGNCSGTITDAGYNISDDASCRFTKTGTANNGDNVNPLFSTAGLANNGGPTETIALQSDSPAIDAIPLAACTDQASPPNRIITDQRGVLRPDVREAYCDIGAYEFQDLAGQPNCIGKNVSTLAQQYGGINAAASALGFSSVTALQNAIGISCGR